MHPDLNEQIRSQTHLDYRKHCSSDSLWHVMASEWLYLLYVTGVTHVTNHLQSAAITPQLLFTYLKKTDGLDSHLN